MAITRPSTQVPEAWFSDERSPSRRLHVSWHGAERMIVLSIWYEDRCTASFRMPVQDAGRMIAAVADAMSRAISLPGREIERTQPPWWRVTLQQIQTLLRHRVSTAREAAVRRRAPRRTERGSVKLGAPRKPLRASALTPTTVCWIGLL